MKPEPFLQLDRVIHERGRLAIMSMPAASQELSFFAVFLAVPIARAWRERKGVGEPDLILTLGNAAAYFGAVYVTLDVVRPPLEGPWAFVLASLYLALALVHRARVPGDEAGSSLLEAIGWIFFVIAFPLVADGPWVTLGWAATGVALIRLAPRVRSPVAMWGGLVTLLLAVMRAAVFDPRWYPASRPVWNFPFAVQLLVVVALAVAGYQGGTGCDRCHTGGLTTPRCMPTGLLGAFR